MSDNFAGRKGTFPGARGKSKKVVQENRARTGHGGAPKPEPPLHGQDPVLHYSHTKSAWYWLTSDNDAVFGMAWVGGEMRSASEEGRKRKQERKGKK